MLDVSFLEASFPIPIMVGKNDGVLGGIYIFLKQTYTNCLANNFFLI